jgi:triacylglycerol lipase
MASYLKGQGFRTFAINLVPNDGSVHLQVLAWQLNRFIEAIGSPVDLVGFSMGGLVARCYIQRMGGNCWVRRFIAIGTPNHGTWAASLTARPAGKQMRINSPFIDDLNSDVAMLLEHDVMSIWTPFDLMILPSKSAKLTVGRAALIPAPMHHMLLSDPRTSHLVSQTLSAR